MHSASCHWSGKMAECFMVITSLGEGGTCSKVNMFSGRDKQAFFRIKSVHENEIISYHSLRESSLARYGAAVCEKNILHKVLELLSIPNSLFWRVS